MDLLPTDDQSQIAEAATDFFSQEMPVTGEIDKPGLDREQLKRIAELGLVAASLSEEFGGIGLGLVEDMLVFRSAGKYLVSPSLLATNTASKLAAAAGDADLAMNMATGEAKAAFAVATKVDRLLVLDGEDATHLVTWTASELKLFDANVAAEREASASIDNALPSAVAAVNISEQKPLAEANPKGEITCGARVQLTAMLVGLSEGARDLGSEYAGVREQFGKPIGSFQGIKHKCSDMVVRTDAASAHCAFAAVAVQDKRDDALFQSLSAKLIATRAAHENASANVQIHGAMGFTAECAAHRYVKRAHILDQLGGNSRQQAALLLEQPAAM